MFKRLICVAALWHGGVVASDAVGISPGDVGALVAAIEAAQAAPPPAKPIALSAGTYVLGDHLRFPEITRETTLIGGNAVLFTTNDSGPFPLFTIRPGGALVLEGMALSDLGGHEDRGEALIVNDGELALADVAFVNVFRRLVGLGRFGAIQAAPVIVNRGTATLERVAFHDSGHDRAGGILTNLGGTATLDTVHIASRERSSGGAVWTAGGVVTVLNSTIVGHATTVTGLLTEPLGVTRIGNSIVSWHGSADCGGAGQLTSLGHNTTVDCPLDATGDIRSKVPLRASEPRRWMDQQLALHIPSAAGGSVDSADLSLCADRDLVGAQRIWQERPFWDGDHDGVPGCDRGAVERRTRARGEGGANGVYFDPASDGHYVTVIVNDSNTLVLWNTFDKNGNAAWVFATGELVGGQSYLGEAYTNEGGRLTEGGPPVGQTPRRWGVIELELQSCDRARLIYESDRPEFGRGELTLRRLAVVRELGCTDVDQPFR